MNRRRSRKLSFSRTKITKTKTSKTKTSKTKTSKPKTSKPKTSKTKISKTMPDILYKGLRGFSKVRRYTKETVAESNLFMMICLRVSLSSRNIFQILLLERDDRIFNDTDNRISLKFATNPVT